MHNYARRLLAVLDGGAHRGEAWRRWKGWEVAEELEAVLSWHHGRAGELSAVRMDGDGIRDGTDEVPTTTTSTCCLDTGKRRGESRVSREIKEK
jgi:hypothetical protein